MARTTEESDRAQGHAACLGTLACVDRRRVYRAASGRRHCERTMGMAARTLRKVIVGMHRRVWVAYVILIAGCAVEVLK